MTNKPGKRFEVELQYTYIERGQLLRWLGALAAVAAIGAALFYLLVLHPNKPSVKAEKEIARAEEFIAQARAMPTSKSIQADIAAAARQLDEARIALGRGAATEAQIAAEQVSSTVRRLIATIRNPTADALIVEVGGRVEVQRASRQTWEAAKPGMQLFEGDFVKTGSNGVVEVMSGDGTFYRIKPETLFEVHRTSTGAGDSQKRSEIKFITGTVDVNTGEGARSRVRTDTATTDIASQSSVGVEVDAQKKVGVSTFKGSATLSTAEGQVTVGERERAVAGRGGIASKQRLPEAPSLVTPDDNAGFDLKAKAPIAIRWIAVKEAARYRLQISKSRLFVPDSLVVDLADREKPEALVAVTEEGSYFWRVATIAKDNLTSEWSLPRRFRVAAKGETVGAPDATPPALTLETPQVNGNVVFVTGRTEVGATLTVNGESVDIDASGGFRKILTLYKDGRNAIEAKAVDAAGNETVRRASVVIQTY